jgi:hypothetical protein
MSTPTDVILRELKSIDIGAIDPHNMARTLSRVLDLTIPALSEIVAPTAEETVDELMEFLEDYIEEGIEEMHDHSSDHGWQYDRGHPNWNATMDDLRTRLTKLLTTP